MDKKERMMVELILKGVIVKQEEMMAKIALGVITPMDTVDQTTILEILEDINKLEEQRTI